MKNESTSVAKIFVKLETKTTSVGKPPFIFATFTYHAHEKPRTFHLMPFLLLNL
jgi:hypothetical protein